MAMKIEKGNIKGKEVHYIRVSNPDKPQPNPKPFCLESQVDSFISCLKRYLKNDPDGDSAGYYRELLSLLEQGIIPFVV